MPLLMIMKVRKEASHTTPDCLEDTSSVGSLPISPAATALLETSEAINNSSLSCALAMKCTQAFLYQNVNLEACILEIRLLVLLLTFTFNS